MAQEQVAIERPEDLTPVRCQSLADALQTQITRCQFAPSGAATVVWGTNLGNIDFLSTLVESEDENGQTQFDRELLARKTEAFLDTVRSLTLLEETPSVMIERVDNAGRIFFNQSIHGLRVRGRTIISLDPLTGRVMRISGGQYWSSDDVSPPSDSWVRLEDAAAFAINAIAEQFGFVETPRVIEHRLEWAPTSDEGLRPYWYLGLHPSYDAWVDALSGEAQVRSALEQ
ncbi:MAG: hypothetical protein PVF63_09505 [Gammaproteobacteria bacterium]|jgi:hypothetical protein